MPFKKGDIVSLDFEMPDTGHYDKHSAVVISCEQVYNHDKCYICVMMSSNNTQDRFSFKIEDHMLEKPGNKQNSQVRCHLITYVREIHIHPTVPYNKLLPNALEKLMAYIMVKAFDL